MILLQTNFALWKIPINFNKTWTILINQNKEQNTENESSKTCVRAEIRNVEASTWIAVSSRPRTGVKLNLQHQAK